MRGREKKTCKRKKGPRRTKETVSGLVCPYASANESATTVPGSAHGISTNKLTRRFHLFDFPVAVTAVTQKLQTRAATAARPAISRLLTKTERASASPARRAKFDTV